MTSLPDSAGNNRRAWLLSLQTPIQSDFEKSLAFRLTVIVAVFVIGINVLELAPAPVVTHAAHATV
ncbi:hypothetical protein [Paraburkholderia sp. DGU8]|uniref:hypothetical protein n=1 Tax=Paraburkholderia sp. DGU8 TaxID=3161997 RepID=UPI003467D01B